MPTRDVPPHEWPEFLASFSRQHRTWLATVEEPGHMGANRPSEPRPFASRLRQSEAGADRALEIVDDEGRCTRLRFRAAARVASHCRPRSRIPCGWYLRFGEPVRVLKIAGAIEAAHIPSWRR